MFSKKSHIKHNRLKSSTIPTNKILNLYNDKNLTSNITNLSTLNTNRISKVSKFDTNKVNKIIQIKSPFYKKREKTNIKLKLRNQSSISKNKTSFHSVDEYKKKLLRGKLCNIMKKNIVLCESKFHPRKYTESISNVHVKSFKNRFKNLDDRNKVGIFTNRYPSILNIGDKFYARYFDYFMSPDEILAKNFTKEEIFQIKTEPEYYNIGGTFDRVNLFRKKQLKDTLNEEEKIGIQNIMEIDLQKSLLKSKNRIRGYLNYYTSVMSRRGFIK